MYLQKNLLGQVSASMPDYDQYKFSFRELVLYTLMGVMVAALFAYIFYRSFIAFLFLLPLVFCVLKIKKNECKEKRKQKLTIQFREMMNTVIAHLSAGYSIENSFINSYRDMVLLFGKEACITKELGMISKALRNNRNIEQLLEDLGRRSHVSDINDFAEIFKIAKRSGGNLPDMIKNTAIIINEKIEVKRKIETVISAKKYEQNIMNMVPFAIILYLNFSSPGYFDSLYHNVFGIVIMTILVVIYLAAYMIATKITNISF